MKRSIVLGLSVSIIGLMSLGCEVSAQPFYKIKESKDIDMKLSGTSTLHKWEMNARTFTGEADFKFSDKGKKKISAVKSLDFSLEVTDLKSDEKALDKNAYKALKATEYKDILYTLTSTTVTPQSDGRVLLKTLGNLSIAGVTKNVAMDVYSVVNKDGTITCTGSYKLKMTDYQVKPPTFMLGAMKTGDNITLDFILVYND
jgi:polyisoprenoid-binding protein YceI